MIEWSQTFARVEDVTKIRCASGDEESVPRLWHSCREA